jgi:hypothetical protein
MEEDESTNQNPVKKQDFCGYQGSSILGIHSVKIKSLPRMNTDSRGLERNCAKVFVGDLAAGLSSEMMHDRGHQAHSSA